MNQLKLSGFNKFLAFLLITVIVIVVIAFAVNSLEVGDNSSTDNTNIVNNSTNNTDKSNGNTNISDTEPPTDDENSLTPPKEEPTTPPAAEPEYYNKLTGLAVSETEYTATPYAILVNPNHPLYGISDSDMTLEIPIENGESQLLFYSSADEILWKIGSLMPTRNYVSDITRLFGGIIVSYGKKENQTATLNAELDLSAYADCYYTENAKYFYTSENMINIARSRDQELLGTYTYKDAPFVFSDNITNSSIIAANNISIPYSNSNITTLRYDITSEKYLYCKSDAPKMDMLTGESISYKNIFVLFANSTTYETASDTEVIMDTDGGGRGYYISMGKFTEFTWTTDASGKLTFKNLMGEELSVNKGNSYIAYYKASQSANITIN